MFHLSKLNTDMLKIHIHMVAWTNLVSTTVNHCIHNNFDSYKRCNVSRLCKKGSKMIHDGERWRRNCNLYLIPDRKFESNQIYLAQVHNERRSPADPIEMVSKRDYKDHLVPQAGSRSYNTNHLPCLSIHSLNWYMG